MTGRSRSGRTWLRAQCSRLVHGRDGMHLGSDGGMGMGGRIMLDLCWERHSSYRLCASHTASMPGLERQVNILPSCTPRR